MINLPTLKDRVGTAKKVLSKTRSGSKKDPAKAKGLFSSSDSEKDPSDNDVFSPVKIDEPNATIVEKPKPVDKLGEEPQLPPKEDVVAKSLEEKAEERGEAKDPLEDPPSGGKPESPVEVKKEVMEAGKDSLAENDNAEKKEVKESPRTHASFLGVRFVGIQQLWSTVQVPCDLMRRNKKPSPTFL
jgi:hypothetical protein